MVKKFDLPVHDNNLAKKPVAVANSAVHTAAAPQVPTHKVVHTTVQHVYVEPEVVVYDDTPSLLDTIVAAEIAAEIVEDIIAPDTYVDTYVDNTSYDYNSSTDYSSSYDDGNW